MSKGLKALVLVSCMVIVVAGLKLAAPIVVPFLLASFLAIVSAPLVFWMAQQGVPRVVSVGTAFLGNLILVALLGRLVIESSTALYQRLPRYQDRLIEVLYEASEAASSFGFEVAPERLLAWLDVGQLFGVFAGALKGFIGTLVSLLLVLLIVVFMLLEAAGLRGKLKHILAEPNRDLGPYAKTTSQVQKYLVVKTVASLITGVLAGTWNFALGVELALLLGVLAFALNFIPTIGSILAAVPAMLLALVTGGVSLSLVVAGGYLVINTVIGNFFEPRILGRALGLSPLVVLLSVIFWGWILGPVGALLSVPMTNVLRIFIANTDDLRWLAILLGPTLPEDEQPFPLASDVST